MSFKRGDLIQCRSGCCTNTYRIKEYVGDDLYVGVHEVTKETVDIIGSDFIVVSRGDEKHADY